MNALKRDLQKQQRICFLLASLET